MARTPSCLLDKIIH